MYKHLFGPVPSRRLGMSLGVDLVPHKVCSLNCVYCESGQTTLLTTERKEYILYKNVTQELDDYFRNNPDPDYITFSGAGEPTLNSRIGDVLQFIKKNRPGIPVAVLTNGTLFGNREVRESIMDADLVLPSLDAVSEAVFNKLNRPASGLVLKDYIDGLVQFSSEFRGRIWLEIFILPGYNDDPGELENIRKVITRISPESVQLNTLDRPGTEPDLHKATSSQLQEIVNTWNMDTVTIIASAPQRKKISSYRSDTENAILETIRRRPCTLDDLTKILGLHINEVNKYLDVLESEDKIESNRQDRGLFYRIK
jgi:wyosine [tRNA(Phe)-imidazoG37] synthetase (radical SAM superfamily)